MSALRALFAAWRDLPAFAGARARLDSTALSLATRRAIATTGYAIPTRRGYRISIRVGYDSADARATLLHEMAHVAAGWRAGRVHSRAWRAVFFQAAAEALGHRPPEWEAVPHSRFAIHEAVRAAFAAARRARRRA